MSSFFQGFRNFHNVHERPARVALLLSAFLLMFSASAFGQAANESTTDPIFVTARIFQLKAKTGSYEDLNNQVFRMKTESLAGYEQWVKAFGKTYPGFEAALLRTESRKVFRTSKPTVITLARQSDGRTIQVDMYGAHGSSEENKPSTTLIPEISLHFGNDEVNKPISYNIQPFDVASGTTYFFASTNLKLNASDYARFVRTNVPPEAFAGQDIYLVFAFSVDLQKSDQPPRYLDERQSISLQESATKKVQLEVPASLRSAGLGGFIRVRVEIAPDGKVTQSGIHLSTFPELNEAAVAAARQWEFPATLFATDKTPITGFVTFNLASQPPAKKPATAGAKQ